MRAAGSRWSRRGPSSGGKQAEAKQRYTDGMAHYNIEDYDGAIKEFQAGYLAHPDPSFLYNIGQSYRMLKRWDKAADYYRRGWDRDDGADVVTCGERLLDELLTAADWHGAERLFDAAETRFAPPRPRRSATTNPAGSVASVWTCRRRRLGLSVGRGGSPSGRR